MTDAAVTARIPRDAFESELFRREIERQFLWEQDGIPLRVGVGEHVDSAGCYSLMVMMEPQTFDVRTSRLGQRVTGSCWLTEDRHGGPLARWSLPTQRMIATEQHNDARTQPKIAWG